MKPYIVFTAVTMTLITALVFIGDAGKYDHDIALMKTMAEEAACGAALCIDMEKYSAGAVCFDTREGEDFIKSYLKVAAEGMKNNLIDNVSYEVEYADDMQGYRSENIKEFPCVTIKLRAEIEDAFSLPLIQITSITSEAKYEYVY